MYLKEAIGFFFYVVQISSWYLSGFHSVALSRQYTYYETYFHCLPELYSCFLELNWFLLTFHFCSSSFSNGFLKIHVLESESEVAQSCLTRSNPVDCSLPGSAVHGILQARILEWVAISFSRGSSPPRDRTQISHIAGRFFTVWDTSVSWCVIVGQNLLIFHFTKQGNQFVYMSLCSPPPHFCQPYYHFYIEPVYSS